MRNDIVALMVWKEDPTIATPIFHELEQKYIVHGLKRIYYDLRTHGREQDVTIDDVVVYKIGDMLRPLTKTVWE